MAPRCSELLQHQFSDALHQAVQAFTFSKSGAEWPNKQAHHLVEGGAAPAEVVRCQA